MTIGNLSLSFLTSKMGLSEVKSEMLKIFYVRIYIKPLALALLSLKYNSSLLLTKEDYRGLIRFFDCFSFFHCNFY